MTPDRADILIIGAGIIGLTLARELVKGGRGEILVIEKEPEPGRHASGRNSGVLHAGIYYSPDSLKAKSCLNGNRLMKQYCREKGLPLRENGKVIVARSSEELATLTSCSTGPRRTVPGWNCSMNGSLRRSSPTPEPWSGRSCHTIPPWWTPRRS